MRLTLCNFSKRLNSTKQPTGEQLAGGKTFNNVTLKEITNIDNPVLKLAGASDNDYAYNYAYIHDWGRYYHIKTADLRHEDIYSAKLELDDLATYKSQILNTSAFIVYSSTGFNRWLRDDRIPIQIKDSTYEIARSAILVNDEPLFEASEDETVLFTTISEDFGLATYIDTESGLNWIMQCISSNDNPFDALVKQFGDVMGAFVQIIRLPVKAEHLDGYGPIDVELGKYVLKDPNQNVVQRSKTNKKHIYATGSIGIPATYVDFRYTEPYCKATLSLPFIGCVDIPLSVIAPSAGINWRLDLDVLTGTITYTLSEETYGKPFASYQGKCGGTVPIAAIQTPSIANAIQGFSGMLASAGLSFATQNPIPAGIGGINAISGSFFAAQQEKNSVIGSYSGGRSEFALREIRLTVEKFKTGVEPDNLTAFEGRPVYKVDSLSNYTGYIKTQGFSIDLPANSDVVKSINSKLDAGIYIE